MLMFSTALVLISAPLTLEREVLQSIPKPHHREQHIISLKDRLYSHPLPNNSPLPSQVSEEREDMTAKSGRES